MDEWTEIRRKVLVEGASKRSILREYGIGHRALTKMLANAEPPGYRMAEVRRKPVIGPPPGHHRSDPGRRQRGPAQTAAHHTRSGSAASTAPCGTTCDTSAPRARQQRACGQAADAGAHLEDLHAGQVGRESPSLGVLISQHPRQSRRRSGLRSANHKTLSINHASH